MGLVVILKKHYVHYSNIAKATPNFQGERESLIIKRGH